MTDRDYYSVRNKKIQREINLDLEYLKQVILGIYSDLSYNYYFQEAFGHNCLGTGFSPGLTGTSTESYFLLKLNKNNIWPIESNIGNYTEDDLFDVIEILHDLVSEPVGGCISRNTISDGHICEKIYTKFDRTKGQEKFKNRINSVLCHYKTGFELSNSGEVIIKVKDGLRDLIQTEIPEYDPENIDSKRERAINKFLNSRLSVHERKDAVKDLADILEYLRKSGGTKLPKKDDSELRNIANNFGIRHHDPHQKTDYDPFWLDWIFYIYLASVNLSIQIREQNKRNK